MTIQTPVKTPVEISEDALFTRIISAFEEFDIQPTRGAYIRFDKDGVIHGCALGALYIQKIGGTEKLFIKPGDLFYAENCKRIYPVNSNTIRASLPDIDDDVQIGIIFGFDHFVTDEQVNKIIINESLTHMEKHNPKNAMGFKIGYRVAKHLFGEK